MVKEQNGSRSSKKKSPHEKTISIIILLIILLIAIGILFQQSNYDLKKYGLVFKKSGSQKITGTSKEVNTDTITPAEFTALSKPFVYNSTTLYEKINGKAPLYLTAGFRKLLTRRYMYKNDSKLWIEAFFYDMGSQRNAFSVYSRQRRSDAVYNKKVLYTYQTLNAEIMVRDNYYIEIIGSKSNPVLKKAISQTAENIRKQLGKIEEITELTVLYDPDLVNGSEKYYIRGAFGFEGLESVYSVKYNYRGEKISAFISGPFSEEKTEKAITSYKEFLINEGSKVEKHSSSIPNLIILNFDGYYEALFHAGKYMAGVHEAESSEQALGLSKKLFNVIKRNSGEKNP